MQDPKAILPFGSGEIWEVTLSDDFLYAEEEIESYLLLKPEIKSKRLAVFDDSTHEEFKEETNGTNGKN